MAGHRANAQRARGDVVAGTVSPRARRSRAWLGDPALQRHLTLLAGLCSSSGPVKGFVDGGPRVDWPRSSPGSSPTWSSWLLGRAASGCPGSPVLVGCAAGWSAGSYGTSAPGSRLQSSSVLASLGILVRWAQPRGGVYLRAAGVSTSQPVSVDQQVWDGRGWASRAWVCSCWAATVPTTSPCAPARLRGSRSRSRWPAWPGTSPRSATSLSVPPSARSLVLKALIAFAIAIGAQTSTSRTGSVDAAAAAVLSMSHVALTPWRLRPGSASGARRRVPGRGAVHHRQRHHRGSLTGERTRSGDRRDHRGLRGEVNTAICTIPRTVNTGLGVMFILAALAVLGGRLSLTDFAVALLLGLGVGIYDDLHCLTARDLRRGAVAADRDPPVRGGRSVDPYGGRAGRVQADAPRRPARRQLRRRTPRRTPAPRHAVRRKRPIPTHRETLPAQATTSPTPRHFGHNQDRPTARMAILWAVPRALSRKVAETDTEEPQPLPRTGHNQPTCRDSTTSRQQLRPAQASQVARGGTRT